MFCCCQNQAGSLHISQDLLTHLLTVPIPLSSAFLA